MWEEGKVVVRADGAAERGCDGLPVRGTALVSDGFGCEAWSDGIGMLLDRRQSGLRRLFASRMLLSAALTAAAVVLLAGACCW